MNGLKFVLLSWLIFRSCSAQGQGNSMTTIRSALKSLEIRWMEELESLLSANISDADFIDGCGSIDFSPGCKAWGDGMYFLAISENRSSNFTSLVRIANSRHMHHFNLMYMSNVCPCTESKYAPGSLFFLWVCCYRSRRCYSEL